MAGQVGTPGQTISGSPLGNNDNQATIPNSQTTDTSLISPTNNVSGDNSDSGILADTIKKAMTGVQATDTGTSQVANTNNQIQSQTMSANSTPLGGWFHNNENIISDAFKDIKNKHSIKSMISQNSGVSPNGGK